MQGQEKMSGKKVFKSDPYASAIPNDKFGMLYYSMLTSKQFTSLSKGAQHLYVCCRVQARSSNAKACLYAHGKEGERVYTDNDFVFPKSHLALFGIDYKNATKYFDQLITAGFIDRKEKNKYCKRVNVYTFSDRWKYTS